MIPIKAREVTKDVIHVVCAYRGGDGRGRQGTRVKGAATREVLGGLAKPRGAAVPADFRQ